MKDRHRQSSDSVRDSIDPNRRRLLQAMAAGTGAAVLGTLTWTYGADASDPAAAGKSGSAGTKRVEIVAFDDDGKRLGERKMRKIVKTTAEWKKQLSPEAFHVTREGGTERAFSGDYTKPDKPGIYRCICCDTALYNAATQFHSGTGWPSFWQPIAEDNVSEDTDTRFGMRRTEIKCTRCDAHLGHVFHDGPQPTGLRYCMDSVALRFVPTGSA